MGMCTVPRAQVMYLAATLEGVATSFFFVTWASTTFLAALTSYFRIIVGVHL